MSLAGWVNAIRHSTFSQRSRLMIMGKRRDACSHNQTISSPTSLFREFQIFNHPSWTAGMKESAMLVKLRNRKAAGKSVFT